MDEPSRTLIEEWAYRHATAERDKPSRTSSGSFETALRDGADDVEYPALFPRRILGRLETEARGVLGPDAE